MVARGLTRPSGSLQPRSGWVLTRQVDYVLQAWRMRSSVPEGTPSFRGEVNGPTLVGTTIMCGTYVTGATVGGDKRERV